MKAKFTEGSIFNHIAIMTLSGTVGLLALFLVDLMDVYFLSLLGQIEIIAAVGFAGSILFFTTAVGIGLSIGCGALVSQVVGKGDREGTKRTITHNFIAVFAVTVPVALLLLLCLIPLLSLLGAEGETKRLAVAYLVIILPSMPLLSVAMACGGVMRALGEAKSAMYLTLIGAIVNAMLDPIFIFVLDWQIQGAALATVIARIVMMAFGLWIVVGKHQLIGKFELNRFRSDCQRYFKIALPALLTNLSTPIGFAFITAFLANFGDAAVSGGAIVGRIQTVAFSGLFALSGAVGPISGQNFGIARFDRIRETLNKSLQFTLVYCAFTCGLLLLLAPMLISVFQASGLTADIIRWFCYGFSLTFLFNGSTFVTNAMLNNLNAAHIATQFNFGKAILGTIPFVYLGALWAGPFGIFAGVMLGAAIVAVLGVLFTQRHLNRLEQAYNNSGLTLSS